eukprot:gnl/MRDRNA2_/MRDRNA2_121726_c0_seq1.p1 gnl/MRDRNA2_/MRDRNA2_121726_c0~~gnl/MRDRNA2_/MRDRNA2_121726_c0_seq1.p1  ORF type:complete len:590 (+),score=104.43 gnl/MRDRNA2_/MRDRNA2_121726_c0_seq1:96-1865(+)
MRATFCDVQRPHLDKYISPRAKSAGRQRKAIASAVSWKQHVTLNAYKKENQSNRPARWDERPEMHSTPAKSSTRPLSAQSAPSRRPFLTPRGKEVPRIRPESAFGMNRNQSKKNRPEEVAPTTPVMFSHLDTPFVGEAFQPERRTAFQNWHTGPQWYLDTEMAMTPMGKSNKISCQLHVTPAMSSNGPPELGSTRGQWMVKKKLEIAESEATKPQPREDSLQALAEKRAKKLYHATHDMPALRPLADFYMWCVAKFGNLTRTWRMLDQDQNMKLTYYEFLKQLKLFDYQGDARLIFRILDRDRSGSLSYFHFDPQGAIDLATLRHWCRENFGSVVETHKILDKDRNGKLTKKEFTLGAIHHGLVMIDSIDCLFSMLDLDHDHKVREEELHFMDVWKPLPFLQAQPDDAGAQKLIRDLTEKYENPIIAWYMALDKNHAMRVCWTEFAAMGKEQGINEKTLPSIWKALDHNTSGWLSLKEFHRPSYDVLVKFKNYCVEKAGSITKAFASFDLNEDCILTRREFFQTVSKELHLEYEEAELLFEGLDLDGRKKISVARLRYLDMWNVEEDVQDEQCWSVIMSSFQTRKESVW